MYVYDIQTLDPHERLTAPAITLRPSRRYYYRDTSRGQYGLDWDGAIGSVLGERLGCVDLKNSPPDYTIYCAIDLGIGKADNRAGKTFFVQPITGIFVPKDYKMKPDVDLIVYLHGYKDALPGDDASIVQYWDGKAFPYFALREGVNMSGKNVILVAPSLGSKSQAGSLVKPGGFDAYLDGVVASLNLHIPLHTATAGKKISNIANIILASHSGGGSPMLRIATGKDKQVAKIRQFWGFDSLNSGSDKNKKKLFTQPDEWLKWAPSTSSDLLIFFKGSTKAESEYLDRNKAKLTNIHVIQSNAKSFGRVDAHFWVPITHWKDSIQNAKFLSNR